MNFIGLLRTLEQIARPPRLGHDDLIGPPPGWAEDWDSPEDAVYDGAAQLAEREAETECLVPEDFNAVCRCVACVAEEQASAIEYADDPMASDSTEPGLTPDELVGVRGILQERYTPTFGGASRWGGQTYTCPSPTIVQSAPPPTVDGEGPASVRDIQPSPEAGRPTSELLNVAADFLSIHASRTQSGEQERAYIRRTLLPELRDRAATFKAIEE